MPSNIEPVLEIFSRHWRNDVNLSRCILPMLLLYVGETLTLLVNLYQGFASIVGVSWQSSYANNTLCGSQNWHNVGFHSVLSNIGFLVRQYISFALTKLSRAKVSPKKWKVFLLSTLILREYEKHFYTTN